MSIGKLPGGVEDLTFGLGTEQQRRQFGSIVITQINASHIPFTGTVDVSTELVRQAAVDSALRADVDKKADSGYIDSHVNNRDNPHEVTLAQIGAAPIVHEHSIAQVVNLQATLDNKAFKQHEHPISDVTGLQTALDGKALVGDSFLKTAHVSFSTGAPDAGKPIVLDLQGKLHPTISGSGLYPVGAWTPIGGNEYPDTTTHTRGAYWIITDVSVTGYLFLTGDLQGEIIHDGDAMIFGEDSWVKHETNTNIVDYYRLDGTVALGAPLAAGGHKLANIGQGTESGDAIEYDQYSAHLLEVLKVDGTNSMGAPLPMGGHRVVNMADGQDDADGVTVQQITPIAQSIGSHIADTDNPHEVTPILLGLGNVDNTSDVNKPISTATQTALDNKVTTQQESNVGNTLGNTLIVTQAEYDVLVPAATTIYFIVG